MRQKIVRRKLTITIPYANLSDGGVARAALEDLARGGVGFETLVKHPLVEFELRDIEETTRTAPG